MAIPTLSAIATAYNELQAIFAVIFGMFIQFVFGDTKTWRIVFLIIISSVFVAMYIVPMVLHVINLSFNLELAGDSKIAVAMYAVSSLISMEILAIFIKFLPNTISKKITKYLGVDK